MTDLEFSTTIEPSRMDKVFLWLFCKVERIFSKNKYGMMSGWWQSWRLDYWAWKTVVKAIPTKYMWLTSEYSVKFLKQLCNSDIKIELKGFLCINEKDIRTSTIEMQILDGDMICTQAKFLFVEKEHNYCRIKK